MGRQIVGCLALVAWLVGACGTSSPAPSATSGPAASPASASPIVASPSAGISPAASGAVADAWYADLPTCASDQLYRCGTLDVPLDSTAPNGPTISIAYYVRPHTDTTQPPLEPVVSVPGGPGYSALGAAQILAPAGLNQRHDMILIDPRGVGLSSPIDCPDLQDGTANRIELTAATAACGKQLGDAADRYGSGDVAIDIESLRQKLGLDTISLLGFSYGSQAVEAYAARYPEHVGGIIIESGVLGSDPQNRWGWDFGKPGVWTDLVASTCASTPACAAVAPDPAKLVDDLLAKARKTPFKGTVNGKPATADEFGIANLLGLVDWGGPSTTSFVTAADAALGGQPGSLIDMVASGLQPPPSSAIGDYSAGEGQAAWCNDVALAWDRADSVATRRSKLAAAIKALPADAFAPVSVGAWMDWAWPDSCLEWPAPDRFEPVIPDGTTIRVPTLILAGDHDKIATSVQAQAVHDAIPGSVLAVIPGAPHGTTWERGCAQDLEVSFLETLTAEPKACTGG